MVARDYPRNDRVLVFFFIVIVFTVSSCVTPLPAQTGASVDEAASMEEGGAKEKDVPELDLESDREGETVDTEDEPIVIEDDHGILRASKLPGYPVFDPSGIRIGTVEDLVLDLPYGFVSFVSIRFLYPEFVEAVFPVPLDTLAFREAPSGFVASVSSDLLANAPRLADLEGIEEPEAFRWYRTVDAFWRRIGEITERNFLSSPRQGGPRYYRYGRGMQVVSGSNRSLSGTLGAGVVDESGEVIGTFTDFFVLLPSGRIEFAEFLLASSDRNSLGVFEERAGTPTPLGAFTYVAQTGDFAYPSPPQTIRDAPEFPGEGVLSAAPDIFMERTRSYWRNVLSEAVHVDGGVRVVPEARLQYEEIVELTIVDLEGEVIATIKDYALTGDGQVPYAVAEFDGTLESDGRLFFVPLSAMSLDPFRLVAALPFVEPEVERFPELSENFLSDGFWDAGPDRWDREIRRFWAKGLGISESRLTGDEQTFGVLASSLLERSLRTDSGEQIGDPESLLIDLLDGSIAAIVVQQRNVLGVGAETHVVPFERFRVNRATGGLILLPKGELSE